MNLEEFLDLALDHIDTDEVNREAIEAEFAMLQSLRKYATMASGRFDVDKIWDNEEETPAECGHHGDDCFDLGIDMGEHLVYFQLKTRLEGPSDDRS